MKFMYKDLHRTKAILDSFRFKRLKIIRIGEPLMSPLLLME